MRRLIKLLVVSISALVLSSCAVLNLIPQSTKVQVAFEAGKVITSAYVVEKDKLNTTQQEAVTKVWETFRDNADKFQEVDFAKFPDFIKTQLKAKCNNQQVLDIANKLIDSYWAKINSQITVTDLEKQDIQEIIIALRDGINSALTTWNLK